MAEAGPSKSQAPGPSTPQQQRQHKVQEAKQNGRKRRLSMNRQKGKKKEPKPEADEAHLDQVATLLSNLAACAGTGDEMETLVSILQPSKADVEMTLTMVKNDLRQLLVFPNNNASIYEFGSVTSGLLLRHSDLDFYVHFEQEQTEREQQVRMIHMVSARMARVGTFTNVVKILGAKVPLLHAVHCQTGLQCDINFSNARGCYNSKLLYAVMQFDRRIHQLALTIKCWARCAHILTIHKQMNSYGLMMMLIFYLQTRKLPVIPSVEDMQQGLPRITFGPWNLGYPSEIKYKTWNKTHVRQLLEGFFQYYAKFEFASNVISPYVGRLCSVAELRNRAVRELTPYYRAIERETVTEFQVGPFVSIQDPFELNLNVGKVLRNSALYEQMVHSFQRAHFLCQQYKEKSFTALLEALFADTEQYRLPKEKKKNKKKTANTPATEANPQGWQICQLKPIEHELFVVKQILLERDPARKMLITDERIRQLWTTCVLDFIVDILRKLYMLTLEPIEATAKPDATATTTTTTTTTPTTTDTAIETPAEDLPADDQSVADKPMDDKPADDKLDDDKPADNKPADNKQAEDKPTDDKPTVEQPPVRFRVTCERQVFIARKRFVIESEADLKHEIEVSKIRWMQNHKLCFKTVLELKRGPDGCIELSVPAGFPATGQLRMFVDTCLHTNLRKCLRGYFLVMLAKAKKKSAAALASSQRSSGGPITPKDPLDLEVFSEVTT